jgi:GntR family transcriptional regulator/MocR family aminotransferase
VSPRQLQVRELLVRVDRSLGGSPGRQLEAQLREAIRSGTLAPGADLPSTRSLAEDLSVSRGVVVRVYAQLAAEGYLDLRQGANPIVRGVPRSAPDRAPAARPVSASRLRYDLRPERPELSYFPRPAWLRALRHALSAAADADLGYTDPRGIEQLRREVATYLGRARGVAADPERIVITAGSTHTLSLLARVLVRRGAESIAFENPSHRLLYKVVGQSGLPAVGIAVDRHGLVVDALARTSAAAVVVSPAHQFPTGGVLSPERRTALLAWARRSGGVIVENDYDAEFRYDRAPIGAQQGLAPAHVAYIGSVSKTLAPGLRLGWAVLPPDLVAPVREEVWNSLLHLPSLDQLALADFLRRGEFDRHLRRMRKVYKRRRDVVVAALAEQLPQVRVSGVAAGLHVVLEFGPTQLEAAVVEQAIAHGVAIESLSEHTLPGYAGPRGLLVGYGAILEPAIPRAIEQLAAAIAAGSSNGTRRPDARPSGRS